MKSDKCIKTLEDCLQSSVQTLEPVPDWIFQQDIDPKHTDKVTRAWFEYNKIKLVKWLKQSPDMNPIEFFWRILKKSICEKRPKNHSEMKLFAKEEEWGKFFNQTMLGTC